MLGRLGANRYLFHDLKVETFQSHDLFRIVREEANTMQAEIDQNLGAEAVFAQVGLEAEAFVGFDGVESALLERIGVDLVGEADSPSLLAHVNKNAFTLFLNALQGIVQLRPAVAPQ